jgi:hypothetical protein
MAVVAPPFSFSCWLSGIWQNAAPSPQIQSAHLRFAAGGSPRLHVAAARRPATRYLPTTH